LADVLEVDPEDIDDDMREPHWALLDKICNAMLDDSTPHTPHLMDLCSQSDVQNWLATNDFADMYSKVFADREIDGTILMTMTMEELLADVLEVDPEDIDDDMREAHWALLYKIWDAVMEEYTPQTSHMMDRCAKSEMAPVANSNEGDTN
jgi:hypothetical protein